MNTRRFRQIKAAARPAYFIVILVLSSIVISELCRMIKQTRRGVIMESFKVRNKIISEIEMIAQQLYKLNITAANLARALSSSLNGTALTFAEINAKIAPTLFLALSIIPQLTQISFIGLDGLLFSYYNDGDQTLAVYSNTSFSSNWYTNPVNRDTGILYGDAVVSPCAVTVNASWIQKALNSSSGVSSMGTKWNMEQDSLVLNTAAMDGRGVISVGFSTDEVVDHFAALDFHGGYFHLSTMDNQVIVQTKLPNVQIVTYNSTVIVQFLRPDGVVIGYDQFSCHSGDGELKPRNAVTSGLKYTFYCSTINIVGVPSVYVLAYPRNTMLELVNKNSRSCLVLLGFVFAFVIISVGLYLIVTARATNREMFLCASLIKQTEATQQAERKSMNKTKAYAAANHDVRACLAAITGLIHLCQDDANPASKLAENLVLMDKCASDLLDILNSILDMSKIEAGKTSLVIEKFNLAQLLEDVVNRFYPVGMKKEKPVDIVLDPCDGSILKSPLVRGDQLKLKQILCNLLNNAIKFTDGGHVSVRAVVKRNNFEKEIIAYNRSSMSKFLSQFCYNKKNENGFNDLDALHTAEEIPNEMEFEFEVDDTGKGIPKDKQKTIFEDYVQVKETDIEHQGCGLGLGIVQSLVRVMKGELRIVDKEPGEKGTCFRFNVFLSVCEPESADTDETRSSSVLNQHFSFAQSKPEGSHVILFLSGEERQKVLKKFIESLNIKVGVIKHRRNFRNELERIKRKLDPSFFSSGRPEPTLSDYSSKSASTDIESGAFDGSRSIRDAPDQITPNYRKNNSKSSLAFVLLVIDPAAASNYTDFLSALVSFRKDLIAKAFCKVVWLENPVMPDQRDKDRQTAGCDYVISKPLHGSQLIQMLSLLPERKGVFPFNLPKSTVGPSVDVQQFSTEFNSSGFELETSSSHSIFLQPTTQNRRQEGAEQPLKGKKVLLVDDDNVIRLVTTRIFQKHGANVEACSNGKEAFHKVGKALSDWRKEGSSKSLPYDYIFMDCQMPEMDGYEATRLIRMEEEHYDVHHPIIALTANAMTEEASKSIDVGMDFHLTKPLQVDKLLNVIKQI